MSPTLVYVLIGSTAMCYLSANELDCSHNDFTNTVIGRMISLERTVCQQNDELLKIIEDLQRNNSKLTGIIDDLRTEVQNLTLELTDLKKENGDLNSAVHSFNNTLKNLQTDVMALHNSTGILNQTTRQIIAEEYHPTNNATFSARLSVTTKILLSEQILVFDEVLTNYGNGYNSASGVFTAPYPGFYLFSLTVLSDHNSFSHLVITKNNTVEVGRFYSGHGHTSNSVSGSGTVAVDLHAGDEICVKQLKGVTSNIYGGGYTSFMGTLVNAH